MCADQRELFYTYNPSQGVYYVGHATRGSSSTAWTTDNALMAFTPGGTITGWPSFDEAHQMLYFERTVGTGPGEIVFVTRASVTAPFGAVTAISTIGVSPGDPEVSRDGTTLVFASDRAGGSGLSDLYLATRACQ